MYSKMSALIHAVPELIEGVGVHNVKIHNPQGKLRWLVANQQEAGRPFPNDFFIVYFEGHRKNNQEPGVNETQTKRLFAAEENLISQFPDHPLVRYYFLEEQSPSDVPGQSNYIDLVVIETPPDGGEDEGISRWMQEQAHQAMSSAEQEGLSYREIRKARFRVTVDEGKFEFESGQTMKFPSKDQLTN